MIFAPIWSILSVCEQSTAFSVSHPLSGGDSCYALIVVFSPVLLLLLLLTTAATPADAADAANYCC